MAMHRAWTVGVECVAAAGSTANYIKTGQDGSMALDLEKIKTTRFMQYAQHPCPLPLPLAPCPLPLALARHKGDDAV